MSAAGWTTLSVDGIEVQFDHAQLARILARLRAKKECKSG